MQTLVAIGFVVQWGMVSEKFTSLGVSMVKQLNPMEAAMNYGERQREYRERRRQWRKRLKRLERLEAPPCLINGAKRILRNLNGLLGYN